MFAVRLGALAGVVAYCPMPFVKKAFIVARLIKELAREVENLGSKSKRDVLPAREVVSSSTVLVASKLGVSPFHV